MSKKGRELRKKARRGNDFAFERFMKRHNEEVIAQQTRKEENNAGEQWKNPIYAGDAIPAR